MKKAKLVLNTDYEDIFSLSVGDKAFVRNEFNSVEHSLLLPPMIGMTNTVLPNDKRSSTRLLYSEETFSASPNFVKRTSYIYIQASPNANMYWDCMSYYNAAEIDSFQDKYSMVEKEFKDARSLYIDKYAAKKQKSDTEKNRMKKNLLANCLSKIVPLFSKESHEILHLYRIKTDKEDMVDANEEADLMPYGMTSCIYDTVSAQQILESPWSKMMAIINYYGWVIPIPMVFLIKDNTREFI